MTLGEKAELLGNVMRLDVPALDGERWGLIMLEKICRVQANPGYTISPL